MKIFRSNQLTSNAHLEKQGMVPLLDGNSDYYFLRKFIRFVTGLDPIKCLIQILLQRLLRTCTQISELPSDRSTMDPTNPPLKLHNFI